MIKFQMRFNFELEDVIYSDAVLEIGTVSVDFRENLARATAIVYESEQKREQSSPTHWVCWAFTTKRPMVELTQKELIEEAENFLLEQKIYLNFVPQIDIAKQIRETGKRV